MSKYKLIKIYPGGPELGTVIDSYKLYSVYPESWEEVVVIEKQLYFDNILTIKRNSDKEIFTIGDVVSIKTQPSACRFTISGFEAHSVNSKRIVYIKTEEENSYVDGLVNIKLVEMCADYSILNRKCLSINDYADVLREQDKSFLFLPKMIEHLKVKAKADEDG